MSIASVDGSRIEQIKLVWWESDLPNGSRLPLARIAVAGDGSVQVALNSFHPMMTKMQKGVGKSFPPVVMRKLVADELRRALTDGDVPEYLTAVQADEVVSRLIGTQKALEELVIRLTGTDK